MGGKGSGRKPWKLPPVCGTRAKYLWHRKRSEHCQLCCDAATEYARQKRGHKPRIRNYETPAQRKARINNLALQAKLDRQCCIDCGLACTVENYFVFDWDHRDPSLKSFTISDKKHGVSRDALLAEIAKCDLRCKNCHAIRTHYQRKFGVISSHNHKPVDIPSLFDLL